jgi:hypothetical protein
VNANLRLTLADVSDQIDAAAPGSRQYQVTAKVTNTWLASTDIRLCGRWTTILIACFKTEAE